MVCGPQERLASARTTAIRANACVTNDPRLDLRVAKVRVTQAPTQRARARARSDALRE